MNKLLAVYKARVSTHQGVVAKESILLEDPGLTHNLITQQLSRDLGQASEQITIKVKVPERQQKIHQTKAYRFDLTDAQGTKHEVRAVGMDSKAVVEETREVKDLVNLFPGAVNKAKLAFNRPHGTVNMLIGMATRSLHCKDGLEVGKIWLNKSVFSP